jgi:CheY-like chemotaxis protein
MDKPSTNILLIEDDTSHAILMIRWLESCPEHRVRHVSNGFAGIDLALSSEWDLIISDIDLPDINGLELCRQIKIDQPLTPVLLTTAHEGIDYPLKAIEYRVDDFLLKPFGKNSLLEKTKRLLDISKLEKTRKQIRVLAIGAHPDDIEIGCGGSLLRHKANGDKICILTINNNETADKPNTKLNAITNVAKQLKSKLIIGNLNNNKVIENYDTINLIKRAVESFKPTVIYTHSANDSHQDHHNVHLATIVAAQQVPSIYCYQTSTVTSDFHPGLFIDISAYINEKIKLVSFYQSLPICDYLQETAIRSTAQFWGRRCNSKEIEPLEVVRAIN